MKKSIFVFLALMMVLSCRAKPVVIEVEEEIVEEIVDLEPVYRLPEPERVFFYRDGTTIYEAVIPVEAIINNSFILPPQVDKNSFTIFQEGKRIFSYSLEDAALLIQLLEEDPASPELPLVQRDHVLLITVSELSPNYPLNVKFGIGRSGITWKLVLDMETAENNTLECNLLASIQTNSRLQGNLDYILAKRPEVILLSSTNIFLEGSDAVFNIGKPLIEPNKTTFMKLEEGKSSYRLVYVWDANRQDRPSAYLYCSNPFLSSLSSVSGNLNSGGLNIDTYSSLRLTPGRQIELGVGDQPLIRTFKSANTQEFPNRGNLLYTHSLEYTITSQLTERAEVEISIPVSFGAVHRNQYHFQRPPDERPGDRMIWKYNLAPGGNASVAFRIDSAEKDNPLYSRFDHYSNGR